MEADPIGLEGGLNPYAYVGSDPVNHVDPSGLSFNGGGMISMNDDMLSNAWMNNLNSIDLNFAQMSFERASSNFINNSSSVFSSRSVNTSSYENMLAWTVAISGGGDSTPIKGYAASSSVYLSNDGGAGLKVGTSGTRLETIGFGASLGVGIDLYKGNLNE